MSSKLQQWDVKFTNAESWTTVMAEGYDVRSTLTRSPLPGYSIKARQLGEIQVTSVRLAWQNISPLENRFKEVGGADDYLYFKIVQSGAFDLISGKNEQSFGPGSVLFVNPDSFLPKSIGSPQNCCCFACLKKRCANGAATMRSSDIWRRMSDAPTYGQSASLCNSSRGTRAWSVLTCRIS